jgi:hypothetical protein
MTPPAELVQLLSQFMANNADGPAHPIAAQ